MYSKGQNVYSINSNRSTLLEQVTVCRGPIDGGLETIEDGVLCRWFILQKTHVYVYMRFG